MGPWSEGSSVEIQEGASESSISLPPCTHQEEITWSHSEMTAASKPRKEAPEWPTFLLPWSWNSQSLELEKNISGV